MQQARCTNFGNCQHADDNTLLAVPPGSDTKCPNCASNLTIKEEKRGIPPWLVGLLAAGAALLVLGFSVWGALHLISPTEKQKHSPVAARPRQPDLTGGVATIVNTTKQLDEQNRAVEDKRTAASTGVVLNPTPAQVDEGKQSADTTSATTSRPSRPANTPKTRSEGVASKRWHVPGE